MKKISIFIIVLLFSNSAHALLSDGLPSSIKQSLSDAYGTKNQYVIDAVIEVSKKKYPAYSDKIDSYVNELTDEKEKEVIEADKKKDSKFSGNIDVALNVANGNTQREEGKVSSQLKYKNGDMENILKLTAKTSKEDSVRTDEEYQVNNQSKYNFTDRDYSFIEFEYVNDRFSGYQYRTSELMGYGRKIVKGDLWNLSAELSAGARQSSLTDGSKEKSLLGKTGLKADWNITDKIKFEQEISSSFGSDAVITISDSAVKTKISDVLYLKFNYNIQHIDDIPADKKHMDRFTSLGIGYEF